MQEHQHWDIIGDIHGHAGQLQDLLAAMGYERKFGSYFHQGGRKALFLGDYIDRGPKIRETLQIVRQMVDSGNALAVMGNHEFNALAYATPDGSGGWLRAHTPDKVAQHVQTQVQIAEPYPDEWRDWLEWFATLPLFLDLGGIRAVHAAWCDESTETFSKVRNLDTQTLHHIMDRQSALYAKRERLLNGVEISLPATIAIPSECAGGRSRVVAECKLTGMRSFQNPMRCHRLRFLRTNRVWLHILKMRPPYFSVTTGCLPLYHARL